MACSQSRQKATAVAALLCLSVIAVSLVGGGLHSSLSPAKIFSSRRGCLHAPHPCNRYPPHYYCCGESWLSSAWNSVRHRCSKDAASHLSRARGSSQVEASGRNGLRPVESGRDRRRRLNEADEVEEKQQQDEGAQGRKKARLAILILSDGEDIDRLHLMLPQIYDPDNIYLVHVDAKTPPEKVAKIREVVEKEFPGIDGGPSNARLLEPAGIVSWGGFSLTLVCTFGMAVALQWDNGWDYFINISSADHPVLTQDEMRTLLGEYADSKVNFMDGKLMLGFEKRWKAYVEDQGLQRDASSHTMNPMTPLPSIDRPYPQLFSLYKGEYWMTLHRSFCEYVSKSPDNVARGLAAYFTGFRISDESYFQTVACHPEGRHFPIHGDSLRFNHWNEDHLDADGRRVDAQGNILIHPEPISDVSIPSVLASGALFARKFDYSLTSAGAYNSLREELKNSDKSKERLDKARARIGREPGDMKGRNRFCKPNEASQHRRRLEALEERSAGDEAEIRESRSRSAKKNFRRR